MSNRKKYICYSLKSSDKLYGFKFFMMLLKHFDALPSLLSNVKLDLNNENYSLDHFDLELSQIIYYTRLKQDRTVTMMLKHHQVNIFHAFIRLSEENNFFKRKNMLQTWNKILLNIIGLDTYADIFVKALKETYNYENLVCAYKIFYNKHTLDENELKEIIKKNRITLNYKIYGAFVLTSYELLSIKDKKQFRSLSSTNKERYHQLIYAIKYNFFLTLNRLINEKFENVLYKLREIEFNEVNI